MRAPLRPLVLAAALAGAGAAHAHPHIFVETGLQVVADDQGRATAIRVTWAYDELYSFLVIEDFGLDRDYDGVLTPEEEAQLAGFDMNWVEGFEGDVYASREGAALPLGPPLPVETRFEEGRIVTVHDRPLEAPLPLDVPLVVEAYDPTFYTLYEVEGELGVAGRPDCPVDRQLADLAAAYDLLEEALYGMPEDPENFPEVGAAFADRIVFACDPGS